MRTLPSSRVFSLAWRRWCDVRRCGRRDTNRHVKAVGRDGRVSKRERERSEKGIYSACLKHDRSSARDRHAGSSRTIALNQSNNQPHSGPRRVFALPRRTTDRSRHERAVYPCVCQSVADIMTSCPSWEQDEGGRVLLGAKLCEKGYYFPRAVLVKHGELVSF